MPRVISIDTLTRCRPSHRKRFWKFQLWNGLQRRPNLFLFFIFLIYLLNNSQMINFKCLGSSPTLNLALFFFVLYFKIKFACAERARRTAADCRVFPAYNPACRSTPLFCCVCVCVCCTLGLLDYELSVPGLWDVSFLYRKRTRYTLFFSFLSLSLSISLSVCMYVCFCVC